MPTSTYESWIKAGDLPLVQLIRLCNVIQLPIDNFIVAGLGRQVPHSNRSVIWEDITYSMRDLYLSINAEIPLQKDIKAKFHIQRKKMFNWFLHEEQKESTITVREFLNVCNEMHYYPLDYIKDAQSKLPVSEGCKRKYDIVIKDKASCSNAKLIGRLNFLEKQMSELKAIIQERSQTFDIAAENDNILYNVM